MASSKRRRRVVVTAMGCLNAFGYGIERTWSALRQGHSAIAPITRFDVTEFRTKVAAEISEEQMLLLPLEHEVVHLSRNAQFSVAAAAELIPPREITIADAVHSPSHGAVDPHRSIAGAALAEHHGDHAQSR